MENNKRIRKIKSDDDFIMLSLNNENEEDNEYIKWQLFTTVQNLII